jgi:mannosyltransferase OCH1-like enzyme
MLKNKQNNIKSNSLINEKITLLKLYRQPYTFFKNNYNSIIPLKIFQTWHDKDLPRKMKERVEILKRQNPRFEHYLYDDNDCREFIKDNFDINILNAYDSLIPGAYKADLWRLCILYINGGIYMDIKFICVNGFKLIELTEHNHFIKDRIRPLSIYNGMIISQKNHPFLLIAINQIVNNVKNKYYGSSPLEPTGPIMLGNLIIKNKLKLNIDMFHYENGGYIIYKNRFIISTDYPEYDSERIESYNKINLKKYGILWNSRNIYK